MSRAAQNEVKKLMALAESALNMGSLEEARTASYAAMKLIVQHRFMVVMKEDLLSFTVTPQVIHQVAESTEDTRTRAPKRRRKPIIDAETRSTIVDVAGDFAGRLVSSALRDVVRGR
jgi:hypothetical protein